MTVPPGLRRDTLMDSVQHLFCLHPAMFRVQPGCLDINPMQAQHAQHILDPTALHKRSTASAYLMQYYGGLPAPWPQWAATGDVHTGMAAQAP